MERFFKLARSELYPDTDGELRLRISPSGAFRTEGEVLTAISESKNGYTKLNGEERTLEDWWEQEIMGKWLVPDEDVWAIKIFVRVIPGHDDLTALIPINLGCHPGLRWDSKR